jgi:hypothetical protein
MYPLRALRGIGSPAQVAEGGIVSSDVFSFHDARSREDGLIEESINWEDDQHAIPFTLSQINADGSTQFRGGVAAIPTSELAHICALPTVGARLTYERAALDGNAYHGNLLLARGTPKPVKRGIAAVLAMAVEEVIPQPDESSIAVRDS